MIQPLFSSTKGKGTPLNRNNKISSNQLQKKKPSSLSSPTEVKICQYLYLFHLPSSHKKEARPIWFNNQTIHDWPKSQLLYTKVNGNRLTGSGLGHEANIILIIFHFPAPKTCIQNFVKFCQMVPEKSKF